MVISLDYTADPLIFFCLAHMTPMMSWKTIATFVFKLYVGEAGEIPSPIFYYSLNFLNMLTV
jgi:hypothetical protein